MTSLLRSAIGLPGDLSQAKKGHLSAAVQQQFILPATEGAATYPPFVDTVCRYSKQAHEALLNGQGFLSCNPGTISSPETHPTHLHRRTVGRHGIAAWTYLTCSASIAVQDPGAAPRSTAHHEPRPSAAGPAAYSASSSLLCACSNDKSAPRGVEQFPSMRGTATCKVYMKRMR